MTTVTQGHGRTSVVRLPAVARLETLITGAVFFLCLNAVVPLVFNPVATSTTDLHDPVSQPLWLLVFAFTVVQAARFHREILAAVAANLPIAFVVVLAVLSTFWSGIGSLTLQYGIQLALCTLFGLYVGVRFGITGLVAILGWVLVLALALSAVFALAFPKYGLDPVHDGRWRGGFTTKNELGRLMVYGGMIWAVRTLTGEVTRRVGCSVVAAFAIVGVLSGSRTALAVTVMLVGISVLAWPYPRDAALVAPLKGLAVTLLLFTVVLTYSSQAFLLRLVGADSNLTGRTGTWSAVWTAIQDHPLFGYGFEAFWRGAQGPSLVVWQTTGYETPHSHNGFLDLLLALGFVGLAAVLAALVLAFARSLEALRVGVGSARMFPFVYLAMLVSYNLTESSLLNRKSLEWIVFVAVAAALPLRAAERRPQPQRGEGFQKSLVDSLDA